MIFSTYGHEKTDEIKYKVATFNIFLKDDRIETQKSNYILTSCEPVSIQDMVLTLLK